MQLYKMNEQLERLIDAGELFVDTETGEVFAMPDPLQAGGARQYPRRRLGVVGGSNASF